MRFRTSITIEVGFSSWFRKMSRQEKQYPTSKHLRVSCHMSSGKLEDVLVPISPGEPIRAYKSDAHLYTSFSPSRLALICPNS